MPLPNLIRAIAATAKTGSTCTADIAGVITTVEVARDLSVSAGDALLVGRSGSTWYAVARTGIAAPAAPVVPPPAPPPSRPPQSGRLIVAPIETRSRQGSRWRTDSDDVYQGQYGGNGNHVGCAFYGSKPRSLAGATVLGASVRVRRLDKGGTNAAQGTTLRLIAESTRPSGAPTLGSSATGPSLRRGQTFDGVTVPTSWAQAMVDGTAGGIAIYDASGSPYVITAGRGSWSAAWTMTILWSR